MVTAHSGALAGEHGAYEALFDAHGVHEVLTLDEMADAMELFSSPRRVTGGSGLGALTTPAASERSSSTVRTTSACRSRRSPTGPARRSTASLDPGLVGGEPDRRVGDGASTPTGSSATSLLAMHDDPDVAAVAFVVDLTRQGEPYDEGYLQIARDVFEASTKPFCVLSNLASAVALEEAAYLRDHGIPVLEGTTSGLVAIRALLAHAASARAACRRDAGAGGRRRARALARAARRRGDEVSEARRARAARRLRRAGDRDPRGFERRRGRGRRGRDRLPRRAEDRGAGRAAQVRRRRRGGGARATPTTCAPRTRTSRAGWVRRSSIGADGARRRRGRARASCATPRSGPLVLVAAGGDPGGAAARPRAGVPAGRRGRRAAAGRPAAGPAAARRRSAGAGRATSTALVRAISRLSVARRRPRRPAERPRREPGDRLADRLRRRRRARDPRRVAASASTGPLPVDRLGVHRPLAGNLARSHCAHVATLGRRRTLTSEPASTCPSRVLAPVGPASGSSAGLCRKPDQEALHAVRAATRR